MQESTNVATNPSDDPLTKAIELYRRYVELAQLSIVANEPPSHEPVGYRHAWDHPLGIHLSSK